MSDENERQDDGRGFGSEDNEVKEEQQWEALLSAEVSEVLSSEKRAVIDEALSIADGVLNHTTSEDAMPEGEKKENIPPAKEAFPDKQVVVNPVKGQSLSGQPIVQSDKEAKTVSVKREKPIRLIVTNDVTKQTPIKSKPLKEAVVTGPVNVEPAAAATAEPVVAKTIPAEPVAAESAVAEAALVAPVAAEPLQAGAQGVSDALVSEAELLATAVTEPVPVVPEQMIQTEPVVPVMEPVLPKETEPAEAEVTGPVDSKVEDAAAEEVIPEQAVPEEKQAEEKDASQVDDQLKMSELFAGTDIDSALGDVPVKDVIAEKPKKKVRTGVKVLFGVLLVLCLLLAGGAYVANMYLDRINYVKPTVAVEGTTDTAGLKQMNVELVLKNEGMHVESADDVEEVDYDGDENLNFLLIGEEAIGEGNSGINGRSDSMMVLSVNTKKNTVKLTSFMRDLYVNVPGYGNTRLNASYQFGGSELVCKTLNENFGIYIDGYVKVNFQGFSDVIDAVGGVEVELTEDEAEYLNTTNYISKKKYRTVVPGKQTLNGNQALGYCRVRKRACITGENDDYGRTARQRLVISNVFDKVKKMRLFDLLGLAYDALPMITTNIPKKQIISYVKLAASMNLKKIDTFRIPADGTYTGQKVMLGNVSAQVLVPDLEANKQAILDFMYDGEIPEDVKERMAEAAAATPTPSPAPAAY